MSALTANPGAFAQNDPIALDAIPPAAPSAGEVIVQFKPGTSEETRDQVLALVEGVFVGMADQEDTVVAKVPLGTELAAAESLIVDPNVLAAEPRAAVAEAGSAPEASAP
jgi:hypothetical protein